ncbi:MAG: DUF1992 domain-containing protein [Acidimicrobiia bacterium]
MTERKPPGASWESWIEQKIRDGMQSGAFDDLPGKGKPIPGLGEPHDDDWWVKEKLRREEVSFLPPTLAVRKELDDARSRIAAATAEDDVRRIVAEINERITRVNKLASSGPPSTVVPLDVERVVADWRDRQT